MNAILDSYPEGITLILPSDPIAGPQAVAFKTWMEEVIQRCPRVLLDLSRVHFVDSAGCAVLLRARKELQARGGRLAICAVGAPVRALFELLQLPRAIQVLATREEATRYLLADHSNQTRPAEPLTWPILMAETS